MILYFSATGNSKYVADRVAAVTGELCISIAECIKAQRFTFSPDKEEPIGILSPVYCWGLPSIMNEFLEKWPPDQPTYLWFAATYGTTSGQAGHFAVEHLRTKGLSAAKPYV